MADDSRIQKFRELLAKDLRDPMLHFGLGIELSKSGRVADAVESFEEAIRVNPKYTAAYRQLGKSLETLGRTDEAQRAYKDGIAIGAETGDLQTVKEMKVFLGRLEADSEA
jgi:Flp pilus assembly protein TadD